jgi:hypothetical protein
MRLMHEKRVLIEHSKKSNSEPFGAAYAICGEELVKVKRPASNIKVGSG